MLRPDDCPTLETAFTQLDLANRYGLRLTEIRRYAAVLEAFARPLLAGLAISALVEILPPIFIRALERANRVFLWSRLVQQLTDPGAEPLKAAEFARLAGLFRLRQASSSRRRSRDTTKSAPGAEGGRAGHDIAPERLRALLQTVYGVTLCDSATREGAPAAQAELPSG